VEYRDGLEVWGGAVPCDDAARQAGLDKATADAKAEAQLAGKAAAWAQLLCQQAEALAATENMHTMGGGQDTVVAAAPAPHTVTFSPPAPPSVAAPSPVLRPNNLRPPSPGAGRRPPSPGGLRTALGARPPSPALRPGARPPSPGAVASPASLQGPRSLQRGFTSPSMLASPQPFSPPMKTVG
jgi:hypothetical protein